LRPGQEDLMAKKVLTLIKLQVPGGAANPAPPVGPALGQHGVNIMEFCKAFNAQTQDQNGRIIPVEITVFEDRSFTFITKTPPAAVLIKEAAGIDKGSGEPNREKVAQITRDQIRQIAETKMQDLNANDVEAAGADIVGEADLAKRIEDGWTYFDVAIDTPDLMPVVGKLGRILGPQGKMPNPKVGTVSEDVRQAVSEAKAGRMEYRTDRSAIVHLAIGKTELSERELLENYAALIDEIVRARPAAAKGRYLRTITLATTTGPGIRVDPARTRDIVEEAPAEEAGPAAAYLSEAELPPQDTASRAR